MDSTYELQKKKNTYYNLIDGLSTITKNLDGSVDNLNDALNKFESAFNIDFLSADNNKISDNHKALVDRNNTIKNVIIPAIYQEIEKINAQMDALETVVEESTTSNVNTSTTSTTTISNTPKTTNTNKSGNQSTSNNVQSPPNKGKMNVISERLLYK